MGTRSLAGNSCRACVRTDPPVTSALVTWLPEKRYDSFREASVGNQTEQPQLQKTMRIASVCMAWVLQGACALVPESSYDSLAVDRPEAADGISTEVMADIIGVGLVSSDSATATHLAGLYAISSVGGFTRISLAKSDSDEAAVTLKSLYDTESAYVVETDGLYADGSDPGSGCTLLVVRKSDGKFFCLNFKVDLGGDTALPRPVLNGASSSTVYIGGYYSPDHIMSVNSFAVPTATEGVEETVSDIALETTYPAIGEFSVNSQGDVLHSSALDSTPALRVVQAGGTTASLASEAGYCVFSGGGSDAANFYWYTGDVGSLTFRKGTRNSSTGAFSAADQTITLPDATSTFTPAAFGGEGGMEPCGEGQVIASDNASYIIGTYVVTDLVGPTTTTSTRLLQMTSSAAAVQAGFSTANFSGVTTAAAQDSSLYLQVSYTDQTQGLVVVDDSTPSSLTEAEWIPGGTYTFNSWRVSGDGKFYFSATKTASSETVFGVKETAAAAVVELSAAAPVFSKVALQPVLTP